MPGTLSVADFKISRAVCELRYEDAYLIFDRTGYIFHDMRRTFTNVKVTNATPTQSLFRSDEGAFALELGQCRFSSDKLDPKLESFAAFCKQYFDAVGEALNIKVFTRVGFRVFFHKDFDDLAKSKAALTSLGLSNLGKAVRFGAEEEPREIALRWESSEIGALLRLSAQRTTVDLDIILPPELEHEREPGIHKVMNQLIIDVDYYTVAPVERAQWDASAWIPLALRTIKRDTDGILSR